MPIGRQAYWQLSGFYFFYFALLGCVAPYWGLYLDHQGYSAYSIGILLAVWALSKVVAPNLWAWLARHKLSPLVVCRIGAAFSIISFLPVFFSPGFYVLALAIFLYSFFWNAILPQFEMITLNLLADNKIYYSRIRLWGSFGFICSVVGLGFFFEWFSLGYLPWIMLLLLILILANTLLVKITMSSESGVSEGFLRYFWQKPVLAFFVVTGLMQMAHGPYYTFFSLHMSNTGYNSSAIGWLWALGVIAEIIVFWYMHQIRLKFSFRFLMLMSLFLAVCRWLAIGWFADSLLFLLVVQCFHGATFGVMHALAMEYIHAKFPGASQGQGQAVYSGISFGVGGALGAYLGGLSWDLYGAAICFAIASGYSLCAFVIAWRYLDWKSPHDERLSY